MEICGQGDLAVVLWRNLAISQGLCMVDTLLLTLCVWEVLNFDWWEADRIAGGFQCKIWWLSQRWTVLGIL